MPDVIALCEVCEEWEHKDGIVDGVCRDCRDLVRRRASLDYEYSDRVGLFMKGLVPSIAPQGPYKEIWTPHGRHRIRWPKEITKLSRQQRIPKS